MGRHQRQTVSLLVADDPGAQFRTVLESAVVVGVIMILMGLALRTFQNYVARSQIVEAMFLTSTIKGDLIEYRAFHGQWPPMGSKFPNAGLQQRQELGRYVDRIDLLQNGAFSVFFNDSSVSIAGKQLTFRPAISRSGSSGPVAWYCGRQSPPAQLSFASADHTDIGDEYLLSVCQEQ